MKRLLILGVMVAVFLAPSLSAAGWQLVDPKDSSGARPPIKASKPGYDDSFRAKDATKQTNTQLPATGMPATKYAFSISGSLKQNIERIMNNYHWKVVWKLDKDYNFYGRVTGDSIPDTMGNLLKPFPLQAIFYLSNKTVAIVERNQ